ncbi:MAG: aromatic amino acid lyase [Firmicutes bacterium]|nr:aromatic amino acid lyase [Bacillota bacterium]
MKVNTDKVVLGPFLDLDGFMNVCRAGATVEFSEEYVERVSAARALVEQWAAEERVMYGVTTGFGSLCTKAISSEETAQLQHNILESHSVSVGQPLPVEAVRGIMLMVLQNVGQGHSGVRIEILEMYREFLNRGITPWVPGDGSVGYLSPEAHIARVIEGNGKVWYQGALEDASEALAKVGMQPRPLSSKEGLALVSGTTSPTAFAAIAVYDMINAAKAADVIGALSLENLRGTLRAFDDRICLVRPHSEQAQSASTVRRMLVDSRIVQESQRLQDALSLRAIPQLHGAAKKTLYDAKQTVETEINACSDNPVIWTRAGEEDIISCCNCDAAYVGIEMDSAAVAAANLAKMSERRNSRLIDGSISGFPDFMVANPGLNSGLMIPQYAQAGLLNEIRVLSSPATIDNTPTCNMQEDYVSMGYNACRKAMAIAQKLEYILAIELLADYQATCFTEDWPQRASASRAVYEEIGRSLPLIHEDTFIHGYIEHLKAYIHTGAIIDTVSGLIGELK